MAIRGEKNAFTMDNEPRRAPSIKYAKQITRSTCATVGCGRQKGTRSANHNHSGTRCTMCRSTRRLVERTTPMSRGLCLSTCRLCCHL